MSEATLLQKRSILDRLLICPSCRGDLKAEQAQYTCVRCQQVYPVTNGIPRFVGSLSKREGQVRRSFNLEHQHYLDSRYLHFTSQLVDDWLRDIQLPRDYFKGKLVLDAGCGSGRWTYAMATLGATVVSVDFTEAGTDITYRTMAHLDNVAVAQASVFELPFRPETFDLVVSWGVLHHTPNTKAAFTRVAPLVKKGGQLYVMIYEKHNPLKFACTALVRWCLRRLPEDRRYRACRLLVIKNPTLYRLLSHWIICAPAPPSGDPLEVSTLQLGLYDAYAPIYNYLHTREEVANWFTESGFKELVLTKPVRFTAKQDIRRLGECGGSVNIRGVRT